MNREARKELLNAYTISFAIQGGSIFFLSLIVTFCCGIFFELSVLGMIILFPITFFLMPLIEILPGFFKERKEGFGKQLDLF